MKDKLDLAGCLGAPGDIWAIFGNAGRGHALFLAVEENEEHRNVVICMRCGYYAAATVRKLLQPCREGSTARGRQALAAAHAGKYPVAGFTHLWLGRLTPLQPTKLFQAYRSRRKALIKLQREAREQVALMGQLPAKRVKQSFAIADLIGQEPVSESD
jgi:hypothetical protein